MSKNIIQFKRDKKQDSKKLHLDKYYTPDHLANELIQHTYEVIGKDKITEVVEPSAGKGSFSKKIPNCKAYDIEPEHGSISKVDYLTLDLPYKEGRLFIGNPPFGDRLNLARKFMKKHYKEGDYIAYILPISQLSNNYNFYEFDLISSIDLGLVNFSGRDIHCCFNIYTRPEKRLNKRKDLYRLPEWIKIEERIVNQNKSRAKEYTGNPDIRICSWGSAGKTVRGSESYVKELGFYIAEHPRKEELIKFIDDFKYEDFEWAVSKGQTPNITIWRMKQHIITHFLKGGFR